MCWSISLLPLRSKVPISNFSPPLSFLPHHFPFLLFLTASFPSLPHCFPFLIYPAASHSTSTSLLPFPPLPRCFQFHLYLAASLSSSPHCFFPSSSLMFPFLLYLTDAVSSSSSLPPFSPLPRCFPFHIYFTVSLLSST